MHAWALVDTQLSATITSDVRKRRRWRTAHKAGPIAMLSNLNYLSSRSASKPLTSVSPWQNISSCVSKSLGPVEQCSASALWPCTRRMLRLGDLSFGICSVRQFGVLVPTYSLSTVTKNPMYQVYLSASSAQVTVHFWQSPSVAMIGFC